MNLPTPPVKFSIIIPNYNHDKFLEQRIQSVLQQTFTDFELIILDDFSTDNSVKIIDKYRNNNKVSHVLINTKNSGNPFIQWKLGIDLAVGEFIWIAESDDLADINFLSEMYKCKVKYPFASLLYCASHYIRDKDFSFPESINRIYSVYQNANDFLTEHLINGLRINNASAVVFKKKIAEKYINDLITYSKHGDYFFWFQIAKHGGGVFINCKLNCCRVLDNSVTRLSWNRSIISFKEHIRIFKVIRNSLPQLTIKQQLFFYDCWGLSFLKMISNFSFLQNIPNYIEILKSSGLNPYFIFRFFYFSFRKMIQV